MPRRLILRPKQSLVHRGCGAAGAGDPLPQLSRMLGRARLLEFIGFRGVESLGFRPCFFSGISSLRFVGFGYRGFRV